jgi:hypothetical protein
MKKLNCRISERDWPEDAKDAVLRMSLYEKFKRGMLQCELVNVLIREGLEDVTVTYDEWRKRWFFTARWDTTCQRLRPLAFAFRAAVAERTWMKIPEDSLWLMEHEDDLLSGTFVLVNSLLPDS